jgi:type VI secretion system protein ImpA
VSQLDLERLLAPVDEERPSGADLSYDDRFFAVETASRPKEPTYLGEREIPGEPPDYRAVLEDAVGLFGETRDLRLAVMITTALLAEEGFDGFADGLALCRGLLEKFWDTMYPELDPEDPDPIERSNALANLNSKGPGGAARLVREAPITGRGQSGPYTLRDHEILTGKIEAPELAEGEELPTLADFTSAADDMARDELDGLKASLERCIGETKAIEKAYEAASRSYQTMEPLRDDLEGCLRCVEEALERRGEAAGDEGGGSGGGDGGGGGGGGGGAVALPGSINSREQAAKAIDLAIRYFERAEPSHPAPLLLKRAQVLINKPFLDLIDELFKLDDIPASIRRSLGIPEPRDDD